MGNIKGMNGSDYLPIYLVTRIATAHGRSALRKWSLFSGHLKKSESTLRVVLSQEQALRFVLLIISLSENLWTLYRGPHCPSSDSNVLPLIEILFF